MNRRVVLSMTAAVVPALLLAAAAAPIAGQEAVPRTLVGRPGSAGRLGLPDHHAARTPGGAR